MEYFVGLVALAAVIYLVTRKSEQVEATPTKVETPEAKVEAVNAQPVAEAKPAPAKKPAAKKPAAPKAAAKKPAAAKKAPAKKTAPKKPKA